jgi:hypothetical protein
MLEFICEGPAWGLEWSWEELGGLRGAGKEAWKYSLSYAARCFHCPSTPPLSTEFMCRKASFNEQGPYELSLSAFYNPASRSFKRTGSIEDCSS